MFLIQFTKLLKYILRLIQFRLMHLKKDNHYFSTELCFIRCVGLIWQFTYG